MPRRPARPPSTTAADTAAAPLYRERMRTPWWWYPVGLFVAGLLAAEFHLAGLPLTDWIPWGTLLPLSVVIVWSFGRDVLTVTAGELRIRDAHLPLDVVSGVIALDERTVRRVVGREGDPAAFVVVRSWVGPGVQLWLDDPDDPAPYWLLSTRHPEELVAVLRAELSR